MKPEVEFKYGGRLFSATRSSNISADIWSKFGMLSIWYLVRCFLIVFLNARRHKSESESRFATVWPPYGRHLGKYT